MVGHKAITPRERFLVDRERERVKRQDGVIKRAMHEITRWKSSSQGLKKENEELKKELVTVMNSNKRITKAVNSSNGNSLVVELAKIDDEILKEVRTALRKSLHPDKHPGLSWQANKALGNIFHLMEELCK